MRIRWTAGAQADIAAIVMHIAEDNPVAARELRDRLKAAVRPLCEHPRIGRLVPEFEDDAIRERIVVPYRLMYAVRGDTIFILGVRHSRRLLAGETYGL